MKTDKQLQCDVLDELQYEPSVDASKIGVIVQNGIVSLSGTVANYAETYRAIHADIAQAVVNALKWHVWVPHDAIKVKVEQGWVTLEGTVDAKFRLVAADAAVRYLTSVKGLTNLITVIRPAINSSEVKTKIENALRRGIELEATWINVEVIGNKVFLRGHVRSWAERSDIERAAWAAPGVGQVEDNLIIPA